MSYAETFAQSVEHFLSETKMLPTHLGRDALGDPNFVRQLREGRAPTATVMDRVAAFMESHRERRETAA